MTDTRTTLRTVIDQTLAADLDPIRNFLLSNPSEPLVATGSGGAETAGEFAALLYGARGGVATAVTPYTLNSFSEASLDLLIRSTEFYHAVCTVCGVDPENPRNPGRIDKRVPMWVLFVAEMKRNGPLEISVAKVNPTGWPSNLC